MTDRNIDTRPERDATDFSTAKIETSDEGDEPVTSSPQDDVEEIGSDEDLGEDNPATSP